MTKKEKIEAWKARKLAWARKNCDWYENDKGELVDNRANVIKREKSYLDF